VTSQQHWVRQTWVHFVIMIALVVVAVVAAVGFVNSQNATSRARAAAGRAQAVAACVNNVLATRQITSSNDALAELSFVASINAIFVLPPGAAQTAAFVAFQKVAQQTAQTLTQDQNYRNAHPLGTC
jgi:hypothetical protein